MLAPVLVSLIHLFENALGRPVKVGAAVTVSKDEHLLLGLVDGSAHRSCMECADHASIALDCALCSTRITLALTLGGRGGSAQIPAAH